MDVAFLCAFRNGQRLLLLADCASSADAFAEPHATALCMRMVEGLLPPVLPDARAAPEAAALASAAGRPLGAWLSAPIRFHDATMFGAVCCFRAAPHPGLRSGDASAVRLLAALVARLLEGQADANRIRRVRLQRLQRALEEAQLTTVYQPILDVASQTLEGYEALTRFHCDPQRPPDWWFAEAEAVGLQAQVETAAVTAALSGLRSVPRKAYLSVNVSPATLLEPGFLRMLQAQPLPRLVLELTEHASVEDYETVVARLAPLRAQGLRIAVDDAGAGFASFRHILRLRPDLIKLDGSLIARIDRDAGARALAGALARFADQTGCTVVAEGVETEAELQVLRQLGIDKAQGFLLGRPAPLPVFTAHAAACQGHSSALEREISTAAVDKDSAENSTAPAESRRVPAGAGLLRK
ncbi:EAL domain-containing protein [Ramlibacter sp. G-1-2-2]|uniref:EAL domain-containing protein n=2 Tax=Ramlibacter agri TaxID=2728837 RepID=A0A848HH23_9BURK|nr:EAL domain-containing protein [Ramlibacter agri]